MKLAKTHDGGADKPKLTAVLIHGIASDSGDWGKALEYLEKELPEVRFVTFDLLGAGKSYAGEELNYDYADQLEALRNSINGLGVTTPLVLVGHSLGTFIVTRYADTYTSEVDRLILVSPPVYTLEDFKNPAFTKAVEAFESTLAAKNPEILTQKSFRNSMDNIVMDKKNYDVLAKLETPTTLIYGDEDQIIASYNVPRLLADNSGVTAVKTHGRHGVTQDKYAEIKKILEKILHA